MPAPRYEQLKVQTIEEGVSSSDGRSQGSRCTIACILTAVISFGLVLPYFTLSIGLTFYQRWLLKDLHFPLSVVIYHLIIKFSLSTVLRGLLYLYTGTPRVVLPFVTSLAKVSPTGLASGIDVGFSNWGLELVNISLYTMTKSTTIVFILLFAILLGLEKKSFSLVMIVVSISAGLAMFTYKATEFNTLGFVLLIFASFMSGLRWTFAQIIMQKSKLGLNNPLDMVYYVQPWMLVSVLPFAIGLEGLDLVNKVMTLPYDKIMQYFLKISFGAILAFTMELSEYLVVTYTSSLTLSVAGIFKEILILVLAVEVTGDHMSPINVLGLFVCLAGISGHIIHKSLNANTQTHSTTIHCTPKFLNDYIIQGSSDGTKTFESRDVPVFRRNAAKKMEHSIPLLSSAEASKGMSIDSQDSENNQSSDSDLDDGRIIFDVLQRRDTIR